MITCKIRRIRTHPPYKYVTEGICVWTHNDEKITVPKGFLTDGSSGGPDCGFSWLIHDFLYSTHKINGRTITRQEADKIMADILKYERASKYRRLVAFVFRCNPFWLCSRAWKSSGKRGAEFLHSLEHSASTQDILDNINRAHL